MPFLRSHKTGDYLILVTFPAGAAFRLELLDHHEDNMNPQTDNDNKQTGVLNFDNSLD